MDHSPDSIFIKDRLGRYLRTNRADAVLLGLENPSTVVGKTDFDLVSPATAEAFVDSDRVVLRSGIAVTDQVKSLTGLDGRVRWLSTTKAPTFDSAGRVTGLMGISRDITSRKLAEEATALAEQRYRELFDDAPVMYLVTEDRDGGQVIADCNALFLRTVGYDRDEVIGRRLIEFLTAEATAALPRQYARALRGELTKVESQLLARDGRVVDVLVRAGTELAADGSVRGARAALIDVTEQKRAEAGLRASEEQLQLALATTLMDTWVWHASEGTLESRNIETLYDLEPGTFQGDYETYIARVHPDDRERVREANAQVGATGSDYDLDFRIVRRDGSVRWMAERGRVVEHDAEGRAVRVVGTTMDVTDRKMAEEALRAGEQQFRLLFASNPHPMWVYDRETLAFLEVNAAAVAHYGYTRDEFLEMTIVQIRPADELARLRFNLSQERPALEKTKGWRHLSKDGRILDVEITSHALLFRGREAVLVVSQDVTARLVLERQLAHQAFHDPLTGLPNRVLFRDRLERALARRVDRAGSIAVLFLDLDEFKVVNDTLGHEVGDRLLVAVADRLRHCLRESDSLARLGGDEFTVLLEDLPDRQLAGVLAERMADALRAPFTLDGRDVVVTASIGIAVPMIGASADEVLRLADVAMYEAKHRGKDRVAVFDVGMDARAWRRLGLETDLRRAISEGELRLHYQSMVSLVDGSIFAVEALVRWEHPEEGLILPGEFVPLAEETGLIVLLGRWVLAEACRQAAFWRRTIPAASELGLAVNLSARQFLHPTVVSDVTKALADSGLPAKCLTLEVTETAAMVDVTGANAALGALKALGVRLAIDDFGAGYAGLGYLRRCPVDGLKIDRSFVAGMTHNPTDMAMVRAVVEFARELGIEVTAEGIETADQLAAVQALGLSQGQGYYFSRPVSAEGMTGLLNFANIDRAPRLAAVQSER